MTGLNSRVPFYSNTADDTHCFQAALRMVMKYYWPEKDFSWDELRRITAKADGLWTWPLAGLLWLKSQGMQVKNIEPFDYYRFINDGRQYLLDFYGPEVGNAQIKHSDIEQEMNLSKSFVKEIEVHKYIPTVEDIRNLLLEDYLVICNVNSRALNNRSGYNGHFVVIKGFDNNHLFLNDPGLPAFENRRVTNELFEKSWAYPDEQSKNAMAFRTRETL